MALVASPPGPVVDAVLAWLRARGHETYGPADPADPGSRERLLRAALATRRPLAVAVLTGHGAGDRAVAQDPALLHTVLDAMGAWVSGQVLLVPATTPRGRLRLPTPVLARPVGDPGTTVVALEPTRWHGLRTRALVAPVCAAVQDPARSGRGSQAGAGREARA